MAGDRRTALLTGLQLSAVTVVAAAAVALPMRADAIGPRPDDLAVGWSLLVGSVLSMRRRSVSWCLGGAGLLWVAVGLAPLAPAAIEGTLERLALFPAALLVCAALHLAQVPHHQLSTIARVLAVAAAAAGAGFGSIGLLGIAAAALLVPIGSRMRTSTASGILLALGMAFGTLGLGAIGLVGLSQDLAIAVGVLTMAVGGIVVGWSARSGAGLDGGGLSIDRPVELERALGRAFGTAPMMVAFPDPDDAWLDPSGRACDPGEDTHAVTDARGQVLARTRPELSVEPALTADLHRFLRAAGDGARLRAALRRRAEEITRSRARLTSAADEERRRLVSRLETGPLRRIDAIADDLGNDWSTRIIAARGTLDDLIAGLGPVASAAELVPALERLALASGAVLRSNVDVPALAPDSARAIWFACAESLANARKHAPGARVTVRLDATDVLVLTVADDGSGGADPHGDGLAGLADRLAAVGGVLEVLAAPVGTVVVARVPLADGVPSAGSDVVPLILSGADGATVET